MMLKLTNILLLCACLVYVSAKPKKCQLTCATVKCAGGYKCIMHGCRPRCVLDCPNCKADPCTFCEDNLEVCERHPTCVCQNKCVNKVCEIPTCFVNPCDAAVCPDQGVRNTCLLGVCPCENQCVPLRVEDVFRHERAIPDECPRCIVNPCQLCTEGQLCEKHPKCSCKDKCVSLEA